MIHKRSTTLERSVKIFHWMAYTGFTALWVGVSRRNFYTGHCCNRFAPPELLAVIQCQCKVQAAKKCSTEDMWMPQAAPVMYAIMDRIA